MISTQTSYTRAGSLDEALAAVAAGAKPLAGGQSLLPMMRLRLAVPEALVDLQAIPELVGICDGGDHIAIGAMTLHRDVAANALLQAHCTVVAEAASGIGSPTIRNRGTLGGTLAHNDPHADMPAALLAVDATVDVRSASGSRTIRIADLGVDYLQTSLAEDELIVAVNVPKDAAASAYVKFHRRAIDWSIVGAAAAVRGGAVTVALTGLGTRPVRATAFEDAVNGGQDPEAARALAGDGSAPMEGLDGSAEYKRHLAGVLAARAVAAARARG